MCSRWRITADLVTRSTVCRYLFNTLLIVFHHGIYVDCRELFGGIALAWGAGVWIS